MLSSRLTLGSRWTFVGGKGGVGKTTAAAALGVELADAGESVLVISVDPAHSLGDALGIGLGADAVTVDGVAGLRALEVDSERERRRFLEANGRALSALLERGTYLDEGDVAEMTELTVPGVDELAALLHLARVADGFSGRVVVDTAPTGHTLRLLELPSLALSWVAALEAMEQKHAAIATAFTGGYAGDEASHFLGSLRDDLEGISRILGSPAETRFLLVTSAEPVVLAETMRYRERLEELGVAVGGIVVNRRSGRAGAEATGAGMVFVPELPGSLVGASGLRRFAAAARAEAALQPPPAGEGGAALSAGGPFTPPLDRKLYLVGGKGGVGKTTVAAALAVRLADARAAPVLLLSVDPAGSLGEVLGVEVGADAARLPGAADLSAQQLDAPAAWADFRDRYREEVENLFAGFMAGGLDAAMDRGVMERLVDLAPPGVDELMALVEVVDLTEDRPYDAIVLDTAPTGHLIRLLELPDLALEWSHALLRLLLKYRDVVHLGDVAERVLKLSRTLRRLREDLSERSARYFIVVALPEALSVPETRRLLGRLDALDYGADAILVNRLLADGGRFRAPAEALAGELLQLDPELPAAGSPDLDVGPVGVEALRRFAASWRELYPGAEKTARN